MFVDFYDFYVFLENGRALLAGEYHSLYPLPLVALFALLSALPAPLSLALVLGGSLVVCLALFKRQALWWIVYVPILETFALGQLSLFWLWLLRRASPLSLALLTLKPHVFLLAVPTLVDNRRLWKPFALWCLVIYMPAFLLRPQWPVEWFLNVFSSDVRITHNMSASLWPVSWLIPVVAVLVVALKQIEWRVLFSAMNPAFLAYDYTLLAGEHWILVPVSWLAFLAMQAAGQAWPMALVGVTLVFISRRSQRFTKTRHGGETDDTTVQAIR